MNKPIRKGIITVTLVVILPLLFIKSCVIYNPKPEDCKVISAKITKIREGSTYDIQFKTETENIYYINRGLEQGLNLDSLNAKVLNKTVTLHLPILAFGPSTHIAQLAVEDEILFTEFKN
ncbi:MAG: hypothetical protein Tsb0033_12500 [Winogradskyella sp.]